MINEMKTPFISVVIPSYNAAKYLPKTFSCLNNQTFRDFEILLIDDGSTDDTEEVVKALTVKYSNLLIRYFKTENGGAAHARNVGLDNARGIYIFCHDADDFIASNALELLAGAARKTGADRVFSEMSTCDENGCVLDRQHLPEYPSMWTYSNCAATLMKKSVFLENNIRWKEGIASEDIYICFLFNLHCKSCEWVKEPLYFWTQHSDSISAPKSGDHILIGKRMMQEILDFSIPIYQDIPNQQDKTLMEYELIKIYCLSIFRTYRITPLKETLRGYMQTHIQMTEAFPNYSNNPYIFRWKKSPIRTFARLAIMATIIAEKIHLMWLLLSVYHIVAKFHKFSI